MLTPQAIEARAPDATPPLTQTRAEEDYAYLADPARRAGAWWEPLAHVPLPVPADAWLGTGVRQRCSPGPPASSAPRR